jgi:branched-subunit amino acid transport protein
MTDTTLWTIVLLSGAATYVWRALGVAIAGRVSPDSETFRLFACIAYAMLAGLIARMVILPEGVLAESLLSFRLIAVSLSVAVFFAFGRNLPLGVAVGVGTFALLTMVWG